VGIGADGSMYEGPYTSAAHGWSTGVLPALTNDLLGATPTGPGFATWSVQPHPGSVKWARGQLPTPHGPLKVSWVNGPRLFTLTVDAPGGTSGTVALPGKGMIRLDGQVVASGALRGLKGHHVITVGA
jgi:hypothetical protein